MSSPFSLALTGLFSLATFFSETLLRPQYCSEWKTTPMDEITGPQVETLIANVIALPESTQWETKRVSEKISAINAYRDVARGLIR